MTTTTNNPPAWTGRQTPQSFEAEISQKQEAAFSDDTVQPRTSVFSELPFYAPPISVDLAILSPLPPMPKA